MGEPLLNYENVIRAARVFSDPAGPAIAAKAISISTAGVLPAIRRYTAEGHHYRLILSLGAPTSAERRRLMPIDDRWPLAEVMAAVRDHAAATGVRATLAYVVIGGVNCSPAHARARGALIDRTWNPERVPNLPRRTALGEANLRPRDPTRVKLNLIDVTDETGQYRRATAEELAAFRDALAELGVPVVRRYSGGADIAAACGTLAATRRGGEANDLDAARELVPLPLRGRGTGGARDAAD
jgi:23S rRNA (adenine2503-C2)-methyltransferase